MPIHLHMTLRNTPVSVSHLEYLIIFPYLPLTFPSFLANWLSPTAHGKEYISTRTMPPSDLYIHILIQNLSLFLLLRLSKPVQHDFS